VIQETLQATSLPRIVIRSYILFFRIFLTFVGLGAVLLIIPSILLSVVAPDVSRHNEVLGVIMYLVSGVIVYFGIFYFWSQEMGRS